MAASPRPLASRWSVLGGLILASCSLLLDNDAAQCRADADCARFSGTRCDTSRAVCVSVAVGDDANAGSGGFSGTGSSGSPSSGASAGLGGVAGGSDPCRSLTKPVVDFSSDVTANFTLSCEKDYLLTGTVFVEPGVTLTIQKGTTIRGSPQPSPGILVIKPGAKLIAVGTRDQPIVMTSAAAQDAQKPGDWGGLIVLGRAPTNHHDAAGQPTTGRVEGLTTGGEFGGIDQNDDSGIIKYLRVEYAGVAIAPNNEVNGITFGGVGRGTIVEYVQVRLAADDCFEFFGGTLNAKHLICQYNGDDGFDWDNGYSGKLQFLVLQQDPAIADETNGFEGDNDATGSTRMPLSNPTIYNATLCGKGVDVPTQQYGMLLRRSTQGSVYNTIVTGFEAGLDLRNADTRVELKSSIFFGNVVRNIAYEEDGSNPDTQLDDDAKLDEISWFRSVGQMNSEADPRLSGCFTPNSPNFVPAEPLMAGAATPPDDGFFDPGAAYIGAFRDANDDWASGAWVVWSNR